MKLYWIYLVVIKLVSCVQYNRVCTFSSGTCHWSIGRRWHFTSLDNGNRILVADAESKEDKRIGFTDAIMTSWLHLSSLCSFDIQLTFRYKIQNDDDRLEIYLIQKNRTQISSLGQWKGNNSYWQQGNVTFKASEEFRIDIEIRHLPEKKNNSVVYFAIDDILIENCPMGIANVTSSTSHPTEMITTTGIIRSYSNESNSTLINISYLKMDDFDSEPALLSSRQTLLTLILYLFCALIALTLLIILFTIIIFTYRKHCCSSSPPMMNQRHGLEKKQLSNRVGIQIENIDHDNDTLKKTAIPVRTCFE